MALRRRIQRLTPIALLAGIVTIGSALGGDDTTPPELKSLRFTPAAIDTTTNAAEVTLSFSVTDDASGVTYFEATFTDATGVARQSATAKFAPALAATNSVNFTFPLLSNPGTWTLSNVMIGDAAGNTLVLDTDGLSGRGIATRLEVKSAQNTASPKLTALEFSPAQIDTSSGPADLQVNYTVTDEFAGVNYMELSFVSPSGTVRRGGSAKFDATQSASKSLTVTFPQLSEPGEWTLSSVFLSNAGRNTLVLNTDGLANLGIRTSLAVKSATDTTPPILTGIRFPTEAIDTSKGPALLQVDCTATDDLSGVTHIEVSFISPAGIRQSGMAKFDPAQSVSKSIAITFPPRSEAGQWTLNTVFLSDAAGNTLILDADAVARTGVTTKLEVRSAPNTTPPSLTGIHFAPEAIDTSQGPATVNVELSATSDHSEMNYIELNFVSPSGAAKQGGTAKLDPAKSVSTTIPVTFPAQSEPGQWALHLVFLSDAAGNTLTLDAEALAPRVGKLQVR
jgi:hypothetical protein